MANNYITFQTDVNASMDPASVTETVAGTTFPVGYASNKTVMVIVNRDVLGTNSDSAMKQTAIEALYRIIKKIEESTNLN